MLHWNAIQKKNLYSDCKYPMFVPQLLKDVSEQITKFNFLRSILTIKIISKTRALKEL